MNEELNLFLVCPLLLAGLTTAAVTDRNPLAVGMMGFLALCWIIGLIGYFVEARDNPSHGEATK